MTPRRSDARSPRATTRKGTGRHQTHQQTQQQHRQTVVTNHARHPHSTTETPLLVTPTHLCHYADALRAIACLLANSLARTAARSESAPAAACAVEAMALVAWLAESEAGR